MLTSRASRIVQRIVAVDDLVHRRASGYPCRSQLWRRTVPLPTARVVKTTLLLGPGIFVFFAMNCPSFTIGPEHRVQRVVWSFRGIDRTNETESLLGIADVLKAEHSISVVVGHHNPHLSQLEGFVSRLPQVSLHVQVDDLAQRFADAFLFVGAVGTTTWERSCLGLPAIAAVVASNQHHAAEALHRDGYQHTIGWTEQTQATHYANVYLSLIENTQVLKRMNKDPIWLMDQMHSCC